MLCAASKDAVVIWSLAAAYAAAADDQPLPEPVLLMSGQGPVEAVAIGGGGGRAGGRARGKQQLRDAMLVVCAGAEVHVFQLPTLENTFRWNSKASVVLHVLDAAWHPIIAAPGVGAFTHDEHKGFTASSRAVRTLWVSRPYTTPCLALPHPYLSMHAGLRAMPPRCLPPASVRATPRTCW